MVGLVVTAAQGVWDPPLPGSGDPTRAWAFLALAIVPALAARWFHLWLLRAQRHGLPRRRTVRRLCRAISWSVPLVVLLVWEWGSWGAFVEDRGAELGVTSTALRLAPLVLAEVGLRLAQQPTARLLRLLDLDVVANLGPAALRMVWFVLAALMVPTAVVDLASLDRGLEVFFHGTHLGVCLGAAILLLVMAVSLPLSFRWFLRTSSHLPPAYAEEIRRTAASLGFSGRQVLSMQTEHRIANAALVGLLPWPRYLVITDALMSLLDLHALRGVIAHEVSHARRCHAVLLILALGVLPMALVFGMLQLGWIDPEGSGFLVMVGLLLVAILVAMRALAHRFEHEADADSAAAMGAEPCVRALHDLGRLLGIDREKSTWRHPSERDRIRVLRQWELDPAMRARFARRGWRMRMALGLGAAVTLGILAWGTSRSWPVDRVTLALYSGDIPGSQLAIGAVDRAQLPEWLQTYFDDVRAEADAALQLLPDGGEWQEIRDTLADRAWREALHHLERADRAGALPFLSLASVGTEPAPVRRTVYQLVRALERDDGGEADRVRGHLAALALDPELAYRLRSLE